MNTRIVHAQVVWAVLAMEAGLALPLVSLPAQGQARPGPLGPLLLALLLPGGYAAVRRYPELRDPSWRMLVGLGLALLGRALVTTPPDAEPRSVAAWIVAAIVPTALGLALWWRGSANTVVEMTALDARTEFAVLAVCMLGVLALLRPFLLPDPVMLVGSVVLFAGGGVIANALARQDAADAALRVGSRALALATAALPCVAAAALVGVLRPGLLGTFWELVSRAILLVLTPIGMLLAWLASFLPRPSLPQPATLPPPPTVEPLPPPANLSDLADQGRFVAMLILLVLVLVAAVLALMVVKIMLEHWLQPPPPPERSADSEVLAESTGGAARDARDLFGWLWRWLRGRFRSGRLALGSPARPHATPSDAWAAYRVLLDWAARNGFARRPSETVHQLESRLAQRAPEIAAAITAVSTTYELERYGAVEPSSEALRRAARAADLIKSNPERRAGL